VHFVPVVFPIRATEDEELGAYERGRMAAQREGRRAAHLWG
jgi:hypothetical protein